MFIVTTVWYSNQSDSSKNNIEQSDSSQFFGRPSHQPQNQPTLSSLSSCLAQESVESLSTKEHAFMKRSLVKTIRCENRLIRWKKLPSFVVIHETAARFRPPRWDAWLSHVMWLFENSGSWRTKKKRRGGESRQMNIFLSWEKTKTPQHGEAIANECASVKMEKARRQMKCKCEEKW